MDDIVLVRKCLMIVGNSTVPVALELFLKHLYSVALWVQYAKDFMFSHHNSC